MMQSDFKEYIIENYECGTYDEENELIIPESKIKIQINEDNSFNVFRDFCYTIDDYNENFLNEILQSLENNTIESLKACFNEEPEINYECGMGCPFDANLVGYWNKPFDTNFLDLFIQTCDNTERDVKDDDINKNIINKIFEVIDDENFTLNEWFIESKDGTMLISTNNTKNTNPFSIIMNATFYLLIMLVLIILLVRIKS